jgi:hypothetical protein
MGSILLAQPARGSVPPKSTSGPKSDSATKIEAFQSRRGRVIITDATPVALPSDIGGALEIKAIALYEPNKESEKVKGVEFVLAGESVRDVQVDLEDLPEIRRACSSLYDLGNKLRDKEDPRAEYTNRSGLRIGIRKTVAYLHAVVYYQGTIVTLPVDSLLKIADALSAATKVLNAQ